MKLAAILAGANAMNMPMAGTPVNLAPAVGPAMPAMNMNMLLPLLLSKDGGMDSDLMMMMMLGGGMGGAGGMGGMNPLMLSLLFKDDIKSYDTYAGICGKVTDAAKKIECDGNLLKIYDAAKKALDPCGDDCKKAHKDIMALDSSSSGISDMLPFLLMSQGGMAGGMNSILPLLLLDNKNDDNKDLLMMMMLSQGGMAGGMAGGMGGINPLMLSLLN